MCSYIFPVAVLALLVACNPVFNWREVRFDSADIVALLPCKPDKGERQTNLGRPETVIYMMGCDTGGTTFAVAMAQLEDAGKVPDVLAQWRAATLVNMHSISSSDLHFIPTGALPLPQSLRSNAKGTRADGGAVEVNAAWFARGSYVYQAVVYAEKIDAEVAETFFSGIRFQ